MNYKIISTGSKGNAVILRDTVLVDCGVPFASIAGYADKLDLVVFTHRHSDHLNTATVSKLHRLRPMLRFACNEDTAEKLVEAGVDLRSIDILSAGRYAYKKYHFLNDGRYEYSKYHVTTFDVPHDVPCMAYFFDFRDWRCFYATDCADLPDVSLPRCNTYLVECNYREDEIAERIAEKLDSGRYIYETRVMETHMSEERLLEWLFDHADLNSEIVLLHDHATEDKQ